jgi:ParB family chromosome partitioning protein
MPDDKRLGRGIGDLLKLNRETAPRETPAPPSNAGQVLHLAVDAVLPNPHQPRKHFSAEALNDLARSIQQSGILQPIVVRRNGDAYELVAGERRWRAARMAGLATVPAVVRDIPDERMLEAALVENIQRADLNPLEKAQAFQRLLDQFGYTQQGLSERVGQERSTVANPLRLLELPSGVKEALVKGTISMGHARALLALRDDAAREAACRRIEAEGLSVREVEQMAGGRTAAGAPESPAIPRPEKVKTADVKALEDQLRQALGTKVEIRTGRGNRKGRILVEYYSLDDFNRLFKRLMR